MKYDDFEFYYNENLNFIKRQKKYHSQDYIEGMYNMLRCMNRQVKLEIEDFPKIFSKTENEEFIYRNQIFQVLYDDYGQQLYIEYKGKTISGGAFNSNPELDFSEQLDDILDEEILND